MSQMFGLRHSFPLVSASHLLPDLRPVNRVSSKRHSVIFHLTLAFDYGSLSFAHGGADMIETGTTARSGYKELFAERSVVSLSDRAVRPMQSPPLNAGRGLGIVPGGVIRVSEKGAAGLGRA